jgi:hypothetical protein
MDSILATIREGLGIQKDYDGFDGEIIVAINSAIFSLKQLGIGPDGFLITGLDEEWSTLIDTAEDIDGIKAYILLKSRMLFDPPTTSFLLEAVSRQITELEWRLMVQVDPVPVEEE